MAIGDMNNNYHLDIVTINKDQTSFTPYFYNPITYKYEASNVVKFGTFP
jgi:hypothetical protein